MSSFHSKFQDSSSSHLNKVLWIIITFYKYSVNRAEGLGW
jgi:hypothetical protein